MSLETEVAALTTATTNLLTAVNVAKATLDTKTAAATDKAASATASAATASGAASAALAIYGTTADLNAAQQIMLGRMNTATAQANLAAASAASASSFTAQDLSAISAALHRSPNAITAMFLYDTSKDSDGGAWVDRCSDKSWENEPLNGPWLGWVADEAAARAISGAATGDYFGYIVSGRFYSLNAGAGVTEVFRGNKRKFPRLAAVIAEATNVTIYDLTAVGCPMWMRFVGVANNWTNVSMLWTNDTSSVAAMNGILLAGNSAGSAGLTLISFIKDQAVIQAAHAYYGGKFSKNIANRNSPTGRYAEVQPHGYPVIINAVVNAVAMTVLPDAPVDQVTGLQVPTIAVATAAGVSVIKHDGTVVNSSTTTPRLSCSISGTILYVSAQYGVAAPSGFVNLVGISAGWSVTDFAGTVGGGMWDEQLVAAAGKVVVRRSQTGGLYCTRPNYSSISESPQARISDKFNTGWMTGDIRRCLLSDTVAGALTATELVTNGTWTGTTGWTPQASAVGITTSAGQLTGTSGPASNLLLSQTIPTVVGKTYRVLMQRVTGASGVYVDYVTPGAATLAGTGSIVSSIEDLNIQFTATTATSVISVMTNGAGSTIVVGAISVSEAIPDRSYKNKPATIYGTLSRTAVAAAAQLMFFSGWSATNYAQAPYSADLDFGTGAWSESAWVNYTTAVASVIVQRSAAAGPSITLGTDATGKLYATAYDGTTTRTVTSAAAYNTATSLKVRANYATDGTLALQVNGVQVASTTGAPLLTMNNLNAVLTLGNARTLDAAFPGSIALVQTGATVPTTEQAQFMFAQENAIFQPGAQCCLPDSGAVVDLAYDEQEDKWKAISAANESTFVGLVRTSTAPVSAGAFTKVAHRSGVKLLARTTTNPGVDIVIPAYGLREELVNRAERAAALAKLPQCFEFDAVAAQTDFVLQAGYTAVEVVAGTRKREGATKDWIRLFDGFKETIRFAVAPGAGVWVHIDARRV